MCIYIYLCVHWIIDTYMHVCDISCVDTYFVYIFCIHVYIWHIYIYTYTGAPPQCPPLSHFSPALEKFGARTTANGWEKSDRNACTPLDITRFPWYPVLEEWNDEMEWWNDMTWHDMTWHEMNGWMYGRSVGDRPDAVRYPTTYCL